MMTPYTNQMMDAWEATRSPSLKPCPVCRKKPKIHYCGINSAWAICKPLFKKAHLIVEVGYAPPSKLAETIIEAWNRRADDERQRKTD